jgi:hypothetical protein
MALGVYGNTTLASVDFSDVDILYSYSSDRNQVGDVQMKPLFDNLTNADFRKMIGVDGVFKLRLPADKFAQIGFYSVIIKPKSILTTILDCSYVITNDQNQTIISKKGIVVPANQFSNTGNLIGYKIEYFDKNNVKIKNLARIVTSADLVSISTNNNTINQGSVGYVLDPNGSSLFLTVSPDESSIVSNTPPDIGSKGQQIVIENTFITPTLVEVEMTDTTLRTLGYGIFGNSTRDIETGILTYYSNTNNIYKQYNLYQVKKQFSNGIIEVKQERTSVNLNQNFNNIAQGLST